MSNFEADRPNHSEEARGGVRLIPVQTGKMSFEELERFAAVQIEAGREICLMSYSSKDDSLIPRPLDLRGIADQPKHEERRSRRRLISDIARSAMVFLVEDMSE